MHTYPLYTALLSDWRMSDLLPLVYLHEHTCELDSGTFLHFKDFEDLLRALGLQQGSPNFFARGPHMPLQNSSRVRHLT